MIPPSTSSTASFTVKVTLQRTYPGRGIFGGIYSLGSFPSLLEACVPVTGSNAWS